MNKREKKIVKVVWLVYSFLIFGVIVFSIVRDAQGCTTKHKYKTTKETISYEDYYEDEADDDVYWEDFDYRDVVMHDVLDYSSAFNEVGYDTEYEVLLVRFKNGGLYMYEEIPQDVFSKFYNSESLGKYYNAHIKGEYPCTKLENADGSPAT